LKKECVAANITTEFKKEKENKIEGERRSRWRTTV